MLHEQCIDGHHGVLCAVCNEGHARKDGVCTICPPGVVPDGTAGLVSAGTLPPLILFVFLLIHFSIFEGKKEKEKQEEKEKAKTQKTSSTKVVPVKENATEDTENDTNNVAARKKEWQQTISALSIQMWWFKVQGDQNAEIRAKNVKAKVVLALSSTLMTMSSSTINSIVEKGAGYIAEYTQGEAEGVVEGKMSETTGDTAGDEIELSEKNTEDMGKTVKKMKKLAFSSLSHKIRILIGWLQITAALVTSFEVPWPPYTLKLFKNLTFINFNFMDLFSPLDPCSMYVPFLKQAAFHMAILPICMLVMFVAAILAMIRNKKRVVLQRVGHFAVTTIFLLYPGIVTRVFTTLKCKTIGDKQYLMADYSVVSFFFSFF
jgi:hypothetical protein